MTDKDEPKPESYYTNFGDAYKIYRDWDIARDIARLVKPKEKQNADEPKRTTRE